MTGFPGGPIRNLGHLFRSIGTLLHPYLAPTWTNCIISSSSHSGITRKVISKVKVTHRWRESQRKSAGPSGVLEAACTSQLMRAGRHVFRNLVSWGTSRCSENLATVVVSITTEVCRHLFLLLFLLFLLYSPLSCILITTFNKLVMKNLLVFCWLYLPLTCAWSPSNAWPCVSEVPEPPLLLSQSAPDDVLLPATKSIFNMACNVVHDNKSWLLLSLYRCPRTMLRINTLLSNHSPLQKKYVYYFSFTHEETKP